MTFLAALCLIESVCCATGWGQAGYSHNEIKEIVKNHPEKIRALFNEALSEMRDHIDGGDRFSRDKSFLIDVVQAIQGSDKEVSPEIANPMAEGLIDLYHSRIQRYPERGPFVVDFVARFGSSKRAQAFVLQALNDQSHGLQEPATNALCWSHSFRGNQKIFAALAENYTQNPKDTVALAAMSRLDFNQARPILKDQIDAAKDIRSFNEVAGIVSQTHDVDLIRALLVKVRSFHITGHDEFTNPYIGIYSEAIAAYINSTEDADLEMILSILPMVGAGYEVRIALVKKLQEGKSPGTRKSVAIAIEELADRGILIKPDVAAALERQAHAEKYPDTATAMETAAKVIRFKLKSVQ